MSFCCPECRDRDHLWQEIMVSGWREVDTNLAASGEREADWCEIEPVSKFGCSKCDWRGDRSEIAEVGIDGEPLPVVHPSQLRIEAA